MNKNNKAPLYFDIAATTRVAPEVFSAILAKLESAENFSNPSSVNHILGQVASSVVEGARDEVAAELGCDPDELVFTSGTTESINLALQGIAHANAQHGRHIVTTRIEHKLVSTAAVCCMQPACIDRGRWITVDTHLHSLGLLRTPY